MDNYVPKEPAILKDEMCLNEFALVMWMTRTIQNIMMCGSSTSMCRTPTPTFGFMWAMCLPIASYIL